MTAAEVPEDAAPAEIEEKYRRIRNLLGSTFVPTVYRRLAVYPAAFTLAVDHLPEVVRLGESTDFVRTAQSAARIPLSGTSLSLSVVEPAVVDVVERYRNANPLNLLFSMSIMGAEARTTQTVMESPLGPAPSPDGIQQDIIDSHGGFITPGIWRDLSPWPVSLQEFWLSTRAIAQDGRLVVARDAVMERAAAVLFGSELEYLPAQIGSLLPRSALSDFTWFPIGVSTMVVEGEWLHTLIAHHQRKEQK